MSAGLSPAASPRPSDLDAIVEIKLRLRMPSPTPLLRSSAPADAARGGFLLGASPEPSTRA
jgi:hypothetical protein